MDALSRDEVRRIDRTAIEQLGVPGIILMENAGRGAADAIVKIERYIYNLCTAEEYNSISITNAE